MRLVAVLALLAWANLIGSAAAQSGQLMTFEEAKQRADNGDAFAQAVVALHYQLGWNTEKNPELAAKYALASANAGEALGQFRLGALLRNGFGVPQDEQQGLKLQAAAFESLHAAQDPYSLTAAGIMIFQGKVVGQNVPQDQRRKDAARLYKKAADMGYAPAQFNYAMCAKAGHGTDKNEEITTRYISLSASQNYPLATSQGHDSVSRGADSFFDHFLRSFPKEGSESGSSVPEGVSRNPSFTPNGLGKIDPSFNPHALSQSKSEFSPSWEYKFHDPESLLNISSENVVGQTVYADERWIVKEHVYLSEDPGFRFFDLYFIDAKTLEVRGRLQSPNALRRVVRTIPDGDNFAILIESPGKHASAPTPTLVLANPHSRELEAVAFATSGMWPQPFIDLELSGREIKVLCVGRTFDPAVSKHAFKSTNFEGLTVSFQDIARAPSDHEARISSRDASSTREKLRMLLPGEEEVIVTPVPSGDSLAEQIWLRRDVRGENRAVDRQLCVLVSPSVVGETKSLSLIQLTSGRILRKLDLSDLSVDHIRLPEPLGSVTALHADEHGTIAVETSTRLGWIKNTGYRVTRRPHASGAFDACGDYIIKRNPGKEKWDSEWPGGWRNEWLLIGGQGNLWRDSNRFSATTLQVEVFKEDGKMQLDKISAPESGQLFPPSLYSGDASTSYWWTFYNATRDTLLYERVDPESASSTFYALRILGADGTRWPPIYSVSAKPDLPNIHLGERTNEWMPVAAQTGTTTSTMPHGVFLLNQDRQTVHIIADGVAGEVKLVEACVISQHEIQVIYAVGNLIKVISVNPTHAASKKGRFIHRLVTGDLETGGFGVRDEVLPLQEIGRWDTGNTGLSPLYSKSHKLLFIPMPGGYELFRLQAAESPKKIAELYLGDGEDFAILLPSGTYAGSPGCEAAFLRSTQPGSLLQASLLAPWRNRPAEVLQALGGDIQQVEVLERVTQRWLTRLGNPEKLSEPRAGEVPAIELAEEVPLWADDDHITMRFRAAGGRLPRGGVVGMFGSLFGDERSSIDRLSIRVNGVEQAGASAVNETDENWSCEVRLAEGQNWIEASSIDVNGRASNPLRFRVLLADSETPARRYIIALGVSEYQDSALNLAYAAKDAQDVSATMRGAAGDSKTLVLLNSDVTKNSLAKIEEFLKPARENDEVVVFCAGHGVLDENLDYVFASHEFDPDRPTETGIKLDDLIDTIGKSKSLKRLLLLDTCHAGQVGERDEILLAQLGSTLPKGVRAVQQRGMSVKPVEGLSAESQQRFIEEMFSLPGLHRGINVIGASGGAEFALESEKWNNGVFTAALIEALRDKKADANGDGRVGVSELRYYLADRVPKLTGGAQKPSVVAFERDQDFDLVR